MPEGTKPIGSGGLWRQDNLRVFTGSGDLSGIKAYWSLMQTESLLDETKKGPIANLILRLEGQRKLPHVAQIWKSKSNNPMTLGTGGVEMDGRKYRVILSKSTSRAEQAPNLSLMFWPDEEDRSYQPEPSASPAQNPWAEDDIPF